MNSRRHSRLLQHQLLGPKGIRRLERRIADMVASEVMRIAFGTLERMVSGEARGGAVKPRTFLIGENGPELLLPRAAHQTTGTNNVG